MKNPEEIKKGLECCSTGCADDCFDCPYGDAEIGRIDDHCIEQLLRDNITRNQQIEKRIIHLEALNQQNLSVITTQERTRARLEERISQLEAQVPRWIPVEERPPEVGVDVSIIIENGGYQYKRVGWMRKSGEWFQAGLGVVEGKVTHWAYLPEAPKEDANA